MVDDMKFAYSLGFIFQEAVVIQFTLAKGLMFLYVLMKYLAKASDFISLMYAVWIKSFPYLKLGYIVKLSNP